MFIFLGRVWSLGKALIGALDGVVITSGSVMGHPGTWPVFCLLCVYVFAMDLGFGTTATWPFMCFASWRGQRAGQVYYWAGSGHQGESQLEWLDGVVTARSLGMVWFSGRVLIGGPGWWGHR